MKANQYRIRYRPASDQILITKEVPGENLLAWDFTGDALNSLINYVRQGAAPTKPTLLTKILRRLRVRHSHEVFTREIKGLGGANVRITVEHIL